MLSVYGWAVARSSRAQDLGVHEDAPEIEGLDDAVDRQDDRLFDALEVFLAKFEPPDFDWHFRRHMNNDRGILLFASSRNHRGEKPSAIKVLEWLAQHGESSYGLAYLHDDEDPRSGGDFSERFQVWRLLSGKVEELADPFLYPVVPDVY